MTDREMLKEIELMRMKLDILKLKANDYGWQCEIPRDTREQLEAMLIRIDQMLQPTQDSGGSNVD